MKTIIERLEASAEMDKAITETRPEPECLPWLFALGTNLPEAAAIETETCSLTYLTEAGWTSVVAVGYSPFIKRYMATACLFRDDGYEVANLNSHEDGVVMCETLLDLMDGFKVACQNGIDKISNGEFGDASTPTNVNAMNWLLQLRDAADLAVIGEVVASFGSFRVTHTEDENKEPKEADVIVLARLVASNHIKSAQAMRNFVFKVRTEEDGKGGVFNKTIEAKDSAGAWLTVVKDLKTSGLLKLVTSLEMNTMLKAAMGSVRGESPYEWFTYSGADVVIDSQGHALKSGDKFGLAPASIGDGRFIHMVIDAPGLGIAKVLTVATDKIKKLVQTCKRAMF